ncbi:hypothetical protein RND71_035587 [Anisodus tanguticus]|uniref:Uncharacterized protein n=1 Tax=Anisodus tanguticus TaxID=243964 RepID=A0AAE1R5T7_9SOLA|nr:hypothetical protein RND71_035587 [Anisodus tanguticus]
MSSKCSGVLKLDVSCVLGIKKQDSPVGFDSGILDNGNGFAGSMWRHHVIHYEGQGGPVQASSKPISEILILFGRAAENLRPDVQHLLSLLNTDASSSIYAAIHPKII